MSTPTAREPSQHYKHQIQPPMEKSDGKLQSRVQCTKAGQKTGNYSDNHNVQNQGNQEIMNCNEERNAQKQGKMKC
jgi:hypothetical protein